MSALLNSKLNIKKKKYERALVLSGGAARGPYQLGIWQYLEEMGWKPDLICGTSVGALNAIQIGFEKNIEEIKETYKHIDKKKILHVSNWAKFKFIFLHKGHAPLIRTKKIIKILEKEFEKGKENLRNNEIEIVITAVNILSSKLEYFNNSVIDVEHAIASASIPIIFPWQYIDRKPYWDGSVMMNTPLWPAIESGAKEIIVVLSSPIGKESSAQVQAPRTRLQAIERMIEQRSIASYDFLLTHINWCQEESSRKGILQDIFTGHDYKGLKIITVAPARMLSLTSSLDFSERMLNSFVKEGYLDACSQLSELFEFY